MTSYHPWRALRALDEVDLHWATLPGDTMGRTVFDRLQILLRPGMTQVERRCTLAHELAHLERGRSLCEAGEESKVRDIAARRLITLEALADAMNWCRSWAEMPDHLWVDEATLRDRLDNLSQLERRWLDGRVEQKERWA